MPDLKEPPEIIISFDNPTNDPGEWAYDHRIGLLTTVIVLLAMAIVFVSSKILTEQRQMQHRILVELLPEERLEEMQQQQRQQAFSRDFSGVRNRVSNLNAANDKGGTAGRSGGSDALAEAAEASQQIGAQAGANREMYETGMLEASAIGRKAGTEGSIGGTENAKREESRAKGSVTVSFSLVNPLRNSVKLYIPAYRCQGGGEVTVQITVDRNGRVGTASVDRSQSSSDPCLTEMALSAAYASRFNTDSSAPESQRGTFFYIFIPQIK